MNQQHNMQQTQQQYQQQQQLQIKSRQVASATNNTSSNTNNNNPKPQQSGSKPTHKKSQSTTLQNNQILQAAGSTAAYQQSHNSTPKGTNSSYGGNTTGGMVKKQQYVQGNQKYQQQQMAAAAFDNRKRSTEVNIVGSGMMMMNPHYIPQQQQQAYSNSQQAAMMLIQSKEFKSTKVSPQRLTSKQSSVQNTAAPITQKLGNAFEGVSQKQLNSMDTSGIRVHGEHAQPNVSASHMNTYQYFNFDMEGIPQNLISQTAQVSHKPHKSSGGGKDMMASRGSMPVVMLPNNLIQGAQNMPTVAEDMNMDSSMHQSFINLIYPSKSKKLMSNEISQANIPQSTNQSSGGSTGHHHKSKSLYVGSGVGPNVPQNHIIQNSFVKPVAHQLAPKGAIQNNQIPQKLQQAAFKKQQNIFTYSQRFKELLNDTMGEDHKNQSPQQQQQQFIPQTHIMVNFGDIQLKQRSVVLQDPNNARTFDNKPLTSHTHQASGNSQQQYLTLHDNQAIIQHSAANKTIDYTQPSPLVGNPYAKTTSSMNTYQQQQSSSHPSKSVVMQQKSKVVQEPPPPSKNQGNNSTLHQRKPSHPVTNNYMLELLQGQQQVQPNPLIQSVGPSSNGMVDKIPREKKQPSQSKKPSNSSAGGISATGHQRSVSDYIHQHFQNEQQQNKLLKFLNNGGGASDQFDQYDQNQQLMIESFEGNIADNQTPLESYRGQPISAALQNFMQQDFSQMLYDGGNSNSAQLSHRQIQQSSYPEQQQQQPLTGTKQAYIILNQGGSLPQDQKSASGYHYRKMSVQQQSSQYQLNSRKSPQKQSQQSKIIIHSSQSNTIDMNNYHKLAQKRRSSPHGSSSSGMIVNNNGLLQQSNNFINSQANNSHNKSNQSSNQQVKQIKQQQQQPQTAGPSIRTSQVSSPQNANKTKMNGGGGQTILAHHSSSATSINNPALHIGAMQQQQQVPHQQQNQFIYHNRSNSDLMKQQIMAAQAAALKKPQQRPNPAINTATALPVGNSGHNKAKSEMTTPRQMQAKKKLTQPQNNATPANVSIDLVTKTTQKPQSQNLQKNGSANNLQQQQLKRKDSFTKEQQLQQQNTPRLKNSPKSKVAPTQQNVAPSGVGKQRYSMQNSPRQVAQQYNLNQQYQMFQQVMAKQSSSGNQKQYFQGNKTETVSPVAAQNSQVQQKNSFVQQQQNNPLLRQSQQPVLNSSKSGYIEDQPQEGTRGQVVSETEYLLNQIRNNINTLKAYQPYQPPNVGPIVDTKKEEKKATDFPRYKRDNLQLPAEVLISQPASEMDLMSATQQYQPLATDPNMSPYSKDLNKLQKLIKFNFRKFADPPATTSEFYRIGRVLGRGAFGKVNLAAHKVSEQLVAIKSINKEFLKSSKSNKDQQVPIPDGGENPEKKKVMQEFAILKQSNHQSVVRLYDTFETTKHICFVMELCAGGDLLTYVRKRRKLTEEVAKYFFKQLIEGLAYLHHSKLIVHRDIKLDNILLDANGKIKIADFGVSRQVTTDTERMSEQCGTPAYIAPEILKDKGYEGFKVDVWSAGVCLYAMLIGTVPFKASSMQELQHLIINGKYDVNNPNAYNQTQNKDGQATQPPQQQTKLSEHAVNLIHSLLQVDPRKRLSAVEVLSHPWLKDSKEELDVFTQKEKDVIHKEYLAKNIDRIYSQIAKKDLNKDLNGTGMLMFHDTEVIFTEHNLDTKTNVGSLLKNASTKSIILAPFNSTVSEIVAEDGKPYIWPEEVRKLIVPKKILKFAPKVKDLDRQYEHNNNADLDNGVYNNVGNEDENNPLEGNNSSSSDSLKGSFKETELSSDDEKAELQVEEAAKKRMKQQQESELQEFEKQIKLKYVRYQEPVEIIDIELVSQIAVQGVYPRDYLLKTLQAKEMNYATACYHLLLKKQQFLAKQQSQLQEEIECFQPQRSASQMVSGGEDTGSVKMIPMY